MVRIPRRLRKNRFRFVLIKDGSKFPFEKKWTTENNYPWYHKKFLDHIEQGGNYGVVCGYGNILVIDCDTEKVDERVRNCFPDTFVVKTGSGGYHHYFICKDLDKSIRLKDDEGVNVGDIQYKGKQVVGPNSNHPNGNKYRVVEDREIKEIYDEEVKEMFDDMIVSRTGREIAKDEELEMKKEYNGSICGISVADVVSLRGLFKREGTEYQGAHPIHGSSTGRNFTLNVKKNTWYCWRHDVGGGPYSLLAIKHGLIKCEEAGRGALDSQTFQKVLKIAKEKYGVKNKGDCL